MPLPCLHCFHVIAAAAFPSQSVAALPNDDGSGAVKTLWVEMKESASLPDGGIMVPIDIRYRRSRLLLLPPSSATPSTSPISTIRRSACHASARAAPLLPLLSPLLHARTLLTCLLPLTIST